jgi:fibronectin type 3 domain-containing protein
MAVKPPSASAVTQVGGQGWFAWAGDYSVSLPYVSGATYAAGTNPWNPQAITDFSTYNTVRFMDWGCTNDKSDVNWTDRKLPTNTDQSAGTTNAEWQWQNNQWVDTGVIPPTGQGMAYEWMVDLCNRANTNLWVCIPAKASNDYVTKMAQLILYGSNGSTPYTSTQSNPTWKPLKSNLNVYIEYSNEVWNASFDQYHWAGQQATAQGLPDEAHFYGRRVVQCDNMFYTVWAGSTSRLIRVLGCQDQDEYWATQEMNQVQADGGTVDAAAVAPYWNVGDGSSSSYNSNATTAINSEISGIATFKTWANSYNLKLVCYEGGMACSVNADQARRNSNNYSLYQTFLSGLNSNGVSLINLYAHVGAVSPGGAWGGKESWGQATSASPTWNGVTTWIANNPGSGNPGGGGGGAPPAPTGLTATAGNAQAVLSWTASSGATTYNALRSTVSGSGYASVATGITSTSYTNTGLTNGTTYYFVVTATNSSGTSGNSNQASATPSAGGSSGPVKINAGGPAVSPFVADVDFSGGTPATNWTGTIDTSAVTNPAPQAVYQAERYGNTTYTIGGLTANTTYQVRLHFCENYNSGSGQRVFNVSINGTSELSNFDIYATTGAQHKANIQQFNVASNGSGQEVIVFTTVTGNALVNGIEVNAVSGPPPAPTGLTATPANAQVALSWTASSGATSYNALRSTVSGSGYASVATGISNTSYTNTGLTNGTTYYFVVTATDAGGASGNSNQASATPAAVTLPIQINAGGPAVSPFVADTDFSGGATATNWTGAITTTGLINPAPRAVYQSERYGNSMYTIPGLTANGSYTVRLHFCENYNSGSGQRVFNVAINGTTVLTNFDIYATTGGQHIANIQQFTENANSSGQMVVEFTTVTGNALINGVEITSATAPPAPTGLTATPGNAQVALSWSASSGATSYNVYRGTTSGGESGTAIATGITGTSYTNTGLTNGTHYYYTVNAVNAGGTSGASNEANATPSTGNTHGGTWAVVCTFTSTATWHNLAQQPNVPTNTAYTASFWMKGTGSVTLVAYGVQTATNLASTSFTATSSWQQFTVTFNTGTNTQVNFDIKDSGGVAGTAYIDDCFMGVASGTNVLVNPGFESGSTSWEADSPTFNIVQNP